MTKKKLLIDPDLLTASIIYVDKQIEVMRKYGTPPYLDQAAFDELVYQCARYPQQLRNLMKKYAKRVPSERKPR
jgi:hypothetical protein